MNKYLIDSDILMDFFKKREYAIDIVNQLSTDGLLSMSILSVTELRSGWTDEEAEFFLSRLYNLVKVFNLNFRAVELAGKFRQDYRIKGVTLPVIDTLIAATAILEKCQLVTRNKRDFPMPEIKFYPINSG